MSLAINIPTICYLCGEKSMQPMRQSGDTEPRRCPHCGYVNMELAKLVGQEKQLQDLIQSDEYRAWHKLKHIQYALVQHALGNRDTARKAIRRSLDVGEQTLARPELNENGQMKVRQILADLQALLEKLDLAEG